MDDKLKLLIEHYDSEVTTLQRLIKEELDIEENYQAASWYQQGLFSAKDKLRLLRSLNEPFYSQKDQILQQITRIKQDLSEFKEGDKSHLTLSMLLRFTEEEYEALSLRDHPPVTSSQPHLFDEAIDKVFSKEMKGINLVINKENNLRFEIMRKRSEVAVTIPCRTRRGKAAWFDEYELKRLAKFGFEVKQKPLRAVKSFILNSKDGAAHLKTFLARCYFEVLNPHPIKSQGYIEYIY